MHDKATTCDVCGSLGIEKSVSTVVGYTTYQDYETLPDGWYDVTELSIFDNTGYVGRSDIAVCCSKICLLKAVALDIGLDIKEDF